MVLLWGRSSCRSVLSYSKRVSVAIIWTSYTTECWPVIVKFHRTLDLPFLTDQTWLRIRESILRLKYMPHLFPICYSYRSVPSRLNFVYTNTRLCHLFFSVGGNSSACVSPFSLRVSHQSFLSFPFMSIPSLQSIRGFIHRNHPETFYRFPWFDSRFVSDEEIFMPYVRDGRLPGKSLLFALECDAFLSHMCALDTEIDVSSNSGSSAKRTFCTSLRLPFGSSRWPSLITGSDWL